MSRPGPAPARRPPARTPSGRVASKRTPSSAGTPRATSARRAPAKPGSTRTGPARTGATTRSPAKTGPGKRPGRVTADARRRRVLLGASVVVSAVILATGLPVAALVSQRHQLSTQSAVLASLRQKNQALADEHRLLSSNAEVERLAREDYQLVAPGQTLYEVLPPAGTTAGASRAGTASTGDPGLQPPVAPADAAALVPGAGSPSTAPSDAAAGASGASEATAQASPPSFVARLLRSLEFWR